MKYKNPILPGFNPDPCILRVKDTYYVLTSTFETYPGINIYESKDLVNFELVAHPLTDKVINMKNNTPSSGVWAPDMTYANGEFYIVYSNMKHWARGPFKDSQNFIIHSKSVEGPWSEPVYINSSGFDASMFHDTDGKSYFVNMEWDFRKGGRADSFTGIRVEEIDLKTLTLKGNAKTVFTGTDRGYVEGPHIYKKDDYYYLFCAEGGTDYNHAESISRSKSIFGPYEVHPDKLLVSSKDTNAYLQKAGHASLVDGKENGWFIAHLCGRPLNEKRSILGRETALQNVKWVNDWPYLTNGGIIPSDTYELVGNVEKKDTSLVEYKIPSKKFDLDFQTLRIDMSKYILKNDDSVTLIGRQSCSSFDEQTTLERRLTSFEAAFEAKLSYNPTSFQHMAGIMLRYQEGDLYFLYVTYDEKLGKVLRILTQNDYKPNYYDDFVLPFEGDITLKISINYDKAQFSYSLNDKDFTDFGPVLDTTLLCDEVVKLGGFTGSMLAIHACDLEYYKKEATFSNIVYKEKQ